MASDAPSAIISNKYVAVGWHFETQEARPVEKAVKCFIFLSRISHGLGLDPTLENLVDIVFDYGHVAVLLVQSPSKGRPAPPTQGGLNNAGRKTPGGCGRL
jgi:hypothetical protein